MSFQTLLGNSQSLLVQFGLLCDVPYLRYYYRPENQQGDGRRDGLLPKDTYACLYPGPVCLRLYPYVLRPMMALKVPPRRMLTCTPPVGMFVSVTS
jgi:hypothetical protein